jgi:hypothetical protein
MPMLMARKVLPGRAGYPGQGWCRSYGVLWALSGMRRRWFVLADLKGAISDLHLGFGTPTRDEAGGARRIEKIDRDRVVGDTSQPSWRHRPTIGAAVRVQPGVDVGQPPASPIISFELAATLMPTG